jgi:hypothetical protein
MAADPTVPKVMTVSWTMPVSLSVPGAVERVIVPVSLLPRCFQLSSNVPE